ncbi:MAG TPA: ACP S-malonyltransferase [Longimicrobiales bacterium]|nr:ACP S-malonyltransferase [Longimicrobiales bacterium]
MVGLLFPGQGSQFVGMGQDLAARFPAAARIFERADEALGVPLSRLMWEGPEDDLTATHNAQPAILTHSVAVLDVVRERIPDVALAAGHSLGEFSAYVAASALTFEDAVRAVRRRGELMFRSGQERPGAMAAVLGLDDEPLERVCREASRATGGECVPANFNAPGQIVISGDEPAVRAAMELAREAGAKRAVPLNVSGAFHSPLMAVAEEGLRAHLEAVELDPPAFPVVSNVTAKPVSDPVEARSLLVRQLTSPVRWTASMRTMRDAGIDWFLELGPGNVLGGLMKRIDREAGVTSLGTADQAESYPGG